MTPTPPSIVRVAMRAAALLAFVLHAAAVARAETPPTALPTLAELEAAGARFGQVRVLARNIFDTSEPKEDKALFRWANRLHVLTRPSVVERALLFKSGDPVSARLVEETERMLRNNRYLYDVEFRVTAVHDGLADIDVVTRDTWTLDLGLSLGRSGGTNTSGAHLNEYNLFGTGTTVGFGHSSDVDRSGNEFRFANDRAFGTWTAVNVSHATNSDGRRNAVAVVRPFYALDARWAAGVSAVRDSRIDAIYNAGNIASQYRHRQQQAEVFGGWSPGLVGGWAQRWSLGVDYEADVYAAEPGLAAPPRLPTDVKLVSPFVRYEVIEDRYDKELNRNLIGRPEFFALGLNSALQLGWAAPGLGSSRNALLYSGSVSRGFEPWRGQTLIAAASFSGQQDGAQAWRQRLGAQAQYYLPQNPNWLFYASAAADRLTHPDVGDDLLLGGDNGLRGYPLRYQSGTRRAQFTVEERFYTDLYVWQLFRIGGAAFYDTGRAWGGDHTNTVDPGWLRNVGIGLRIVSARAAFSNVLHIDFAFPLDAPANIKKVQFLVKTKTSF